MRGTILTVGVLFSLLFLSGVLAKANSDSLHFQNKAMNQTLLAAGKFDPSAAQMEQIQNHAFKSRITARAVSRNLLKEIDGAIQMLETVQQVESESQPHVDVPKSCQRTPMPAPRTADITDEQIQLEEYVETVSRLDENCTKLLNYFRAVKVQVALKVKFIESIPEGSSLVGKDREFLLECLRTARSEIESQLAMMGMYLRQIEKLCDEYNVQAGLV